MARLYVGSAVFLAALLLLVGTAGAEPENAKDGVRQCGASAELSEAQGCQVEDLGQVTLSPAGIAELGQSGGPVPADQVQPMNSSD